VSKRKLFFNSVSSVALLITNLLVTFVMTPIIIHSLGNRNYGIWELLVGLVGYLGLLEFGMGPALVRYVADAHSRDDYVSLNHIFNTAIITLSALGTGGLFVLLGLALWPQSLPVATSEARELVPLLVIFGLDIAAALPRIALSGYLLGLQQHRTYNFLEIIFALIQAVLIYHVLKSGWDSPLIWLSAILFLRTVLEGIVLFIWILMLDRQVRLEISAFRIETMKKLVVFGFKNTVTRASIGLLQKLVSFVIAYTVGVAHIVYFVVPNRLTEYVQSLTYAMGLPLIPYFAGAAGKNGAESTRQAWIQTGRILQLTAFWAALMAAGAGEPFIRVWMGAHYADETYPVLYILCVGLFAQGMAPNSVTMLMSLARHGAMAWFAAIYAVICFGLSVALATVWGIEGVAVAVCLFAIGMSIAGLALACRVLAIPFKAHVRANILPFFTPIALGASAFILLRSAGYPSGYAWLILHASLASLVYLSSAWFLVVNATERTFIRERLFKRTAAAKPRLAASLEGEED
jgi:O-antigen/teichoic acid export membrane protein